MPICGPARSTHPSCLDLHHLPLHPVPRPFPLEPAEGISLGKDSPFGSLFGQAPEASRADSQLSHPVSSALRPQDVNIEDLYKGGEEATRFTFFQRSSGPSFRLEAAAWPGWFLSGSSEPQQPLRLTKESEPSVRTEFYFEQSR